MVLLAGREKREEEGRDDDGRSVGRLTVKSTSNSRYLSLDSIIPIRPPRPRNVHPILFMASRHRCGGLRESRGLSGRSYGTASSVRSPAGG